MALLFPAYLQLITHPPCRGLSIRNFTPYIGQMYSEVLIKGPGALVTLA